MKSLIFIKIDPEFDHIQFVSHYFAVEISIHSLCNTWPRGDKTFFILNSAKHEIYPAHKC